MFNEQFAIEAYKLFDDHEFEGYCPIETYDFREILETGGRFIEDVDDKEYGEFKKVYIYCSIVNATDKTVFTYQYAFNHQNYENGIYSTGVGGYVDSYNTEFSNDLLMENVLEHLDEEVHFKLNDDPKLIGFINDDYSDESKDLFGLHFVVETEGPINTGDSEIVSAEFLKIDELKSKITDGNSNFEHWSVLCVNELEKYLG